MHVSKAIWSLLMQLLEQHDGYTVVEILTALQDDEVRAAIDKWRQAKSGALE